MGLRKVAIKQGWSENTQASWHFTVQKTPFLVSTKGSILGHQKSISHTTRISTLPPYPQDFRIALKQYVWAQLGPRADWRLWPVQIELDSAVLQTTSIREPGVERQRLNSWGQQKLTKSPPQARITSAWANLDENYKNPLTRQKPSQNELRLAAKSEPVPKAK